LRDKLSDSASGTMVLEKETQLEPGWVTEPFWDFSRRRKPLAFLGIKVHFFRGTPGSLVNVLSKLY